MKEYTGNWRDTISTLQNLFNTDNYAQDCKYTVLNDELTNV